MSNYLNKLIASHSKEIIPIPPNHIHYTRNYQLNSQYSNSSRNKEKKDNCKMKFTYIPNNNYEFIHHHDNSTSNLFPKSMTSNSMSRENLMEIKKNKIPYYSNINERKGDIISIFNPNKLLIKNNDKIPSNLALISSDRRKYSKGNLFINQKIKKSMRNRYQLNLNNNYINDNSSIFIRKRISPENKRNLVKFGESYKKIIDKDKRKVIAIDDITIIDKIKDLKKCSSKPKYSNDKINNDYGARNLPQNLFIEPYNSEKLMKYKSIKEKYNNIHSFQNCASSKELNPKKNKTNAQSHTINIKNNTEFLENKSFIIPNYLKELKTGKNSNKNIIKDLKDEDKKGINNSKKSYGDNKKKNQVNNNSININNVFINLENKDKVSLNNQNEYRQLVNEDLKKVSFSKLSNKSKSNKDLNIIRNQIFNNIKQLWKKIGGVTEHYKILFLEKLNYLNNDDKFYFYLREKEQIDTLLRILEKLNKNIAIRNSINSQLKNINSNNCPKKEDISKLLITLRIVTIDIINDYINFKREISYEILNNKYNLTNINNYPYLYILQIENDTNYLYSHEYLSNIYKFSKYSDPFLINPSSESKGKNKYIILPINNYTLQEIRKANYFLVKEKINIEEKKRSLAKSPNNYYNNSKSMRNNNSAKKLNENLVVKNNKKKFDNILICYKINNFNIENKKIKKNNITFYKNSILEIINNNIKTFNKKLKICSKIAGFEINNDKKKEKIKFYIENNIICSKIINLQIINNIIKKYNNINLFNNISFGIINSKKLKRELNFNNKISPCSNIVNIQINSRNNINDNMKKIKKINTNNTQQSSLKNNNIPQTINPIRSSIQKNIQNEAVQNNSIDQEVCPFDSKAYPPIDLLYNAYLKTVNDDIKISFKINPNIFHYSLIGASPKIILFKHNNSILYGMATLSYDSSQIYHRSLMITSISCSNNYSITDTLLKLVDYCDREIEYDELVLFLYFYENEAKKGEYLLNEEFKNMIKTKTKFKWTALENTGNERKIRYHYKKSFSLNRNILPKKKLIKIVKNYIQIRFYRFIKYNSNNCEKGLNTKEYTFLFNVIDLSLKYGKEPDNNNDELNLMFSKIVGLKKKRLLKMITEFNYAIYNKGKAFLDELSKNEDKIFSEILYRRFLPLVKIVSQNHFLGLYYTNISTHFSSIFKKRINDYEYNIISINEFNIEAFRLSKEENNEDYNKYLYFFKSENESISFILYELELSNEKEMEESNINENYKKDLFNKILKKILTKEKEEPAKYFKKIGIPSFRYHPTFQIEKKNQYKITDYDILDGDDWFDFCIENNNNANLFSFPENNLINDDSKIIENSFVIAIINPDLTVDYQIPALNIYYISKNFWIKR